MDVAQLVTVLTQLGLAAAAWRLANSLKIRVEALTLQVTKHQADDIEAHGRLEQAIASLPAKLPVARALRPKRRRGI